MEVLQTHIVKTEVVLETLRFDDISPRSAYSVLFECEKNQWFVRIDDQLELISPESAIHIRCS